MTIISHHWRGAAFAACFIVLAGSAAAQERQGSGGLLDNLFSRGESNRTEAAPQAASPSDLSVRIDRLENALRQLTGAIEQLQFRNQQLEQQVQRLQGGAPPAGAATTPAMPPRGSNPNVVPATPPATTTMPGRRSDVFDPSQNPGAPGAPHALGGGTLTAAAPAAPAARAPMQDDIPVGAPGSRAQGAPLDLSGGNTQAIPNDAALPPPPARNTSATGAQVATLPPSASPKDEYDLAYGYVLRKDYALATSTFQDFLKRHPQDKLVPDANYWLGESLYQNKRYQDAADAFLVVVRNHEKSGKAPDALYRLGQSLAALGQKDMACASLNEVARKYPGASASVKRGVAAEQKRTHC